MVREIRLSERSRMRALPILPKLPGSADVVTTFRAAASADESRPACFSASQALGWRSVSVLVAAGRVLVDGHRGRLNSNVSGHGVGGCVIFTFWVVLGAFGVFRGFVRGALPVARLAQFCEYFARFWLFREVSTRVLSTPGKCARVHRGSAFGTVLPARACFNLCPP